MSDVDARRGNGWTTAESWVRDNLRRLESKVDALDARLDMIADQGAESRGTVKVWQALVIGLVLAGAGVLFGRAFPDRTDPQVQSLLESVKSIQREIEYLKAGDRR